MAESRTSDAIAGTYGPDRLCVLPGWLPSGHWQGQPAAVGSAFQLSKLDRSGPGPVKERKRGSRSPVAQADLEM